MTGELIVHLSREVDAPPSAVFDAWLDPEAIAVFMVPDHAGRASDVRVDARVGGRFSLVLEIGEARVPIHGEYLAIDRPSRLAFRWHDPGTSAHNEVVVTLEPLARGRTLMTLQHQGFSSAAAARSHEEGWAHILAHLAARWAIA